jgi:hypothetical protein
MLNPLFPAPLWIGCALILSLALKLALMRAELFLVSFAMNLLSCGPNKKMKKKREGRKKTKKKNKKTKVIPLNTL